MGRRQVIGTWPLRVAALLSALSLAALGAVIWLVAAASGDAGMRVRDVSTGAPAYVARDVALRTIVGVTPGGPADAAGLRVGDRIVEGPGRPADDPASPPKRAHQPRTGDRVDLTVQRLVPQPPAGVSGFDRYRPAEDVHLILRPALASEWPRLLAASGFALASVAAGLFVAWRSRRRAAVVCAAASSAALVALAGPLVETWHRAPHLGWVFGAGAALAALLPFAGIVLSAAHGSKPASANLGIVVLRSASLAALLSYVAVVGVGLAAVAAIGDDGLRVRPVSLQGLAITRVLTDSPGAVAGLGPGRWVVGVDTLVTRDERQLWRALSSRRPDALSWLYVQGSVRTGSGTGLGGMTEAQVQLRPRLSVPVTAVGLAGVALSGLAALTAAAAATRAPSVAAGPLVGLASSAALLAGVRVWVEAGYGQHAQHGQRDLVAVTLVGAVGGLVLLWLLSRRLPRSPALVLWLAALVAAVLAAAEPIVVPAAEVPADVAELLGFAGGAAPAFVALIAAELARTARSAPQVAQPAYAAGGVTVSHAARVFYAGLRRYESGNLLAMRG